MHLLLVLALRKTELKCNCPTLEFLSVHAVYRLLSVLLLLVLQECEATVQVVRVVEGQTD